MKDDSIVKSINVFAKTAMYSDDENVLKSLIGDIETLRYCEDAPKSIFDIIYIYAIQNLHGIRAEKRFNRKFSESFYQKTIVDNFKIIFPEYDLLKEQHKTKAGGRIDILAKDISSGRSVIIELKVGNKNCARQLYGYAVDFEDPILISITESEPENKQDDIIYYEYSDFFGSI